ncbi:MAG TPA: GNAT family N-acetyltransferase, partial [Bauldia sp.]|nr:GNAT family N-acetyltransferase [Bauldia sp.]
MGSYGLRTYIWNNRLKSIVLLAGFPVLLLLIAFAFALLISAFDNPDIGEGFANAVALLPSLLPLALGAALIWFVIAWFANRAIVAAATGARPLDRRTDPRVWNLLETLCISRGITMPALFMIDTEQRNAFASGVRKKDYAITVTRGLVDTLDDAELEAVLAHELTHIENRDVQLLVISAVFVGIITLVGDLLVRSPRLLFSGSGRSSSSSSGRKGGGGAIILILVAVAIFILARVLALGLRFALSRKREYLADAGAVELTKVYADPAFRGTGLAQALFGEALTFAKADGYAEMMLWSDTRFTRGHRFYEKLGFRRWPGERYLADASATWEYHFR